MWEQAQQWTMRGYAEYKNVAAVFTDNQFPMYNDIFFFVTAYFKRH